MTHLSLPRIFQMPMHRPGTDAPPSVLRLLLFYVTPLSLLPPLLYLYAQLHHPGAVLPMLEPAPTPGEAVLVGFAFLMAELGMVALMASYIQYQGEQLNLPTAYADAYALAAIAPTPLWLSSLSLLMPFMALNVLFVGLAWLVSAGIIRRGVATLFAPYDDTHDHAVANAITFVGLMAWFALMLTLVMLLSMLLGWR